MENLENCYHLAHAKQVSIVDRCLLILNRFDVLPNRNPDEQATPDWLKVESVKPARSRRRSPVRLRQLWWIWPSLPATWSEALSRVRPGAVQIARLTAATTIGYLVASALYPGIVDLTAPLTALLVVQASTVGTLKMGLVRIGAVLTGVLVAVALASYLGLSWWSLATAIAASLVLAKVLRLAEQSLEAPISAMLILAVSSPGLAAEVRLVNTLIGTVVGIVFSLVVPVPIPNSRAADAVRRVAHSQAALLDEIALTLGERHLHPEEVQAWLDWTESISEDSAEAAAAVTAAEESRKLNPRALRAAKVHPGLRAALDRLDQSLASERALLEVITDEAPADPDQFDDLSGLPRVFAVVLDDLANALRAFGDLVRAEFGSSSVDQVDEALANTLEAIQETRAVLTELIILDVDPREQADRWMLRGSVLAAVDQVLRQLELEESSRSTQPWLIRHGKPLVADALRPITAPNRSRLFRRSG